MWMHSRQTRSLLICSLGIILWVGCVEGRRSNHELEHVTPAHWPLHLADAADKLDQRAANLGNAQSLRELQEIIGWLPEVAADTTLTESQWQQVSDACRPLEKTLSQYAKPSDQDVESIRKLSQQLRELHSQLAASAPQITTVAGEEPSTEDSSSNQ